MAATPVTNKTATLATALRSTGSETTLVLQSKETWTGVTSGTLRLNSSTSTEFCSFTGCSESSSNGVYTITVTGVSRGLNDNAATITDASASNKKDHAIGTQVLLVMHSVDINNFVNKELNNTISGNNTFTGTNTFSSTTKATLIQQNVTTAQRTALTGLSNGVRVYDTDMDEEYIYQGGAWYAVASGSTQPDATESVKGVAELATVAEQGSAAVTGGTGAGLVLQARYLKKTSAGASDENKIAILSADGTYDSTFMPASSYKFGGDGSDGAIGAGALTITGSNNTYIVKNYTSFAPGNNTVTVTPTNCIVHIKVSGNADLTNTTFDFDGKGGPGGAGGTAPASGSGSAQTGAAGSAGTAGIGALVRAAAGGAPTATVNNTPGSAGTAGTMTLTASTDLSMSVLGGRTIIVAPGAGASGGSSGVSTNGSATVQGGNGGAGGAGGGCIILEVLGNITFSSTTLNARGASGSNGANGTGTANNATGGGGGGGGGGGCVVVLYGGTATGSPTVNVGAGSAGSAGTAVINDPPNPLAGAAGGAGGASIFSAATSGSNGVAGGTSGAGGAGAAGQSLVTKNTVFQ